MKILCSLLLIVIGHYLFAQQPQWLNPKPFGSDVNDIEFFDQQRGIMVGGLGAIAYTTNGGQDWTNATSGTAKSIKQLERIGPASALAVCDTFLLKTNDGGLTWSLHSQLSGYTFVTIDMVESNVGFALVKSYNVSNEYKIAKSTDGGIVWIIGNNVFENISDISFKNEFLGILVQDQQESTNVYRTTDGGQNFVLATTLYGSIKACGITDGLAFLLVGNETVFFKDNTSSSATRVYKSIDDGVTWLNISPQFYEIQLRGVKSKASAYYIWGINGTEGSGNIPPIILSLNEGLDWQLSNIMPDLFDKKYEPRITALGLKSAIDGYAYCSTNSTSDSEVKLPISTSNAFDWHFSPGNFINCVNDFSFADTTAVMATENYLWRKEANINWDTVAILPFSPFTHLSFASPALGLALAKEYVGPDFSEEVSRITRSLDGGFNWQTALEQGLVSPFSLSFPSWDRAYIFGKRCFVVWKKSGEPITDDFFSRECGSGRFFRSEDLGNTWQEYSLPLDSLNNMQFTSSQTGYLFGGGGSTPSGGYYRTTDGGLNWQYNELGIKEIAKGIMVNDTIGFALTTDSLPKVYRFSRAGSTHLVQEFYTSSIGFTVLDMGFSDAGSGYLLVKSGDARYILSTTNEGAVWEQFGPYAYLENLKVFYGMNGYAYGKHGRLLQLGNGFPVATGRPLAYRQTTSVAKNPFDQELTLRFGQALEYEAVISLYDVHGRRVAQALVSKGSLEASLQTTGLKPGLYLYGLTWPFGQQWGKAMKQ